MLCSIFCEFSSSSNELVQNTLLSCNAVDIFLTLLNKASTPKVAILGGGLEEETLMVEVLITATVGISNLISGARGAEFAEKLLCPATKVQFLAWLFQVPPGKMLKAFYMGTTGLKTIQRILKAGISLDDLETPSIVPWSEFDPTVHPHVVICRHILRILCICGLSHLECLISALPMRVLMAICQTSLGASDAMMKYLGVSLVSIVCANRSVALEFAKVPFIINVVIDRLRTKLTEAGFSTRILLKARATQGRTSEVGPNARTGGASWSTQTMNLYGFVSALLCIIRMGAIVMEVYGMEGNRQLLARQLRRGGKGGGVLGRRGCQGKNEEEGEDEVAVVVLGLEPLSYIRFSRNCCLPSLCSPMHPPFLTEHFCCDIMSCKNYS